MTGPRDDLTSADAPEDVSAFLDGELAAGEVAALDARLGADPVLREEAAALAATRDLLRGLPEPVPPPGFWDGVGAGVRRRLLRERRRRFAFGAAGVLGAAAAAAAVVVLTGRSPAPAPAPDFAAAVAAHHGAPVTYELTSDPVDFLDGRTWREAPAAPAAPAAPPPPSAGPSPYGDLARVRLTAAMEAAGTLERSGRIRIDVHWPGESPRSAEADVVHRGARVSYAAAGTGGARVSVERRPLVPAVDPVEASLAAGNLVAPGPSTTVAGRPAETVVITEDGVLLRRLALDAATGLPLTVEDYSDGRLWRRETYTSLTVGGPVGGVSGARSRRIPVRPPFLAPARVGDMALLAVERHGGGIRCLYGDGVHSASLFEVAGERAPAAGADTVRLAGRGYQVVERGAGRLWYWTTPEVTFTFVGDLPPDEVADFLRAFGAARGSRGAPAGN